VTITEDMVKTVTFDRLVFSAKTQAQLDGIPETYNNVYVKAVPGVTVKYTTKGFMIIVK